MYVSIRYYKSPAGVYAGAEYTYHTDLPLKVGDKVITPTVKEPRQRGIVTKVNVPQPSFPCKDITEYDVQDGNAGGVTV